MCKHLLNQVIQNCGHVAVDLCIICLSQRLWLIDGQYLTDFKQHFNK